MGDMTVCQIWQVGNASITSADESHTALADNSEEGGRSLHSDVATEDRGKDARKLSRPTIPKKARGDSTDIFSNDWRKINLPFELTI